MVRYYQGFFKLKNPAKYIGDAKNIVYRSQWELKIMMHLDHNPKVVRWASEEFHIPYISPIDKSPHRYFPDFYIEYASRAEVWEIKPLVQTKMPTTSNKKRFIKESLEYAKNLAKWEAAEEFCNKRGWEFKILTERDIFQKGIKK